MKKNRMMRVASTLLVAVLLSTCAVSGTYAKYVTSASGSDTARVAKWGVEVGGMANGLFKKEYTNDSETEFTVVSVEEEVVAPGTKNENGVQFSLTGKPEVAVNVKFEVKASDGNNDLKDVFLKKGNYKDYTKDKGSEDQFTLDADYYPVVFTLKSNDTILESGNLSDIKTFLEEKNNTYGANTDLSKLCGETCTGVYTLTWEWVFGGNEQADTLLGNLAAGTATEDTTKYSTSIDFSINITVTQVD